MAKAETVSLAKLRDAVTKAAKTAAERNDVRFEPGLHFNPGIIVGRRILDQLTLEQAQAVAADITKGVAPTLKTAGIAKVSPVVFIRDHIITCGFIDSRQQLLTLEQ